MLDRRAFLAATAAFVATPAGLRAAPRAARITWPGLGRPLHGVMAISSKARGPQPAVLVLGDEAAPGALTGHLLDRLADAGLVACALDLTADNLAIDAPAALDDALATIRWLGGNAYATGRVGAFGVGRGATLVRRLALVAGEALTAAVALGGEDLPTLPGITAQLLVEPLAATPASSTLARDDSRAWEQTLMRATLFLKERLR